VGDPQDARLVRFAFFAGCVLRVAALRVRLAGAVFAGGASAFGNSILGSDFGNTCCA
jgi:hypothetical protein